jgi:pimeloyl-ACP methyl ester carboxylesterase
MHTYRPTKGGHIARLIVPLLVFFFALSGCEPLTAPDDEADLRAEADVSYSEAPEPDADGCISGTQTSGAFYEICVPPFFNGTLVVYAHGFIFPQIPLSPPDRTLDGVDLAQFLGAQGFAFAATSFYTNGLVDANAGVKDLRELITLFSRFYQRPDRVLLLGFSNGAFLSTLALEENPGLFDGALASCGPIGGYEEQLYAIGDVFMTFWAFFGDLVEAQLGMPVLMENGSINPPVLLIHRDQLEIQVLGLLAGRPDLAQMVVQALLANQHLMLPADGTDAQYAQVILINAAYYVYGTNDVIEKLGGQPYTTLGRFPAGVPVPDIRADRNALAQLEGRFGTKGNIQDPLIALHNLFDPLVPFWHNRLFASKVRRQDLFMPVPIDRFGHCAFEPAEVAAAFARLEEMTRTDVVARR